jgi:MFS family permease
MCGSILNPLTIVAERGAIQHSMALTDTGIQVATAMAIVGAALGSFASPVPEMLGYKMTLRWVVPALQLIGTGVSLLPSWYVFILGRFLCGLGTGMAGIVAPILLAEIAAPWQRGQVVSMHQLGITVGIMTASLVGYGFCRTLEDGWRWALLVGSLPAACLLVLGQAFVPDSPRWLIRRALRGAATASSARLSAWMDDSHSQRENDAMLALLHAEHGPAAAGSGGGGGGALETESDPDDEDGGPGADGDGDGGGDGAGDGGGSEFRRGVNEAKLFLLSFRPLSYDFKAELRQMVEEVRDDRRLGTEDQGLGGWWALLEPRYRFHLVFGAVLMTCVVLSGANAIVFYSSTIFSLAGIADPLLASVVTFAVNFAMTILGMHLVDRVGRRVINLVGFFCMAIALGTLGVVITLAPGAWGASLACILIFMGGFAVGPGVSTWVVLGEVVPTRIRARAFALFMILNWALVILLSLVTLTAVRAAADIDAGSKGEASAVQRGVARIFWVFDVMCIAGLVFTATSLPETAGKSLEEVQDNLAALGLLRGCFARTCSAAAPATASDAPGGRLASATNVTQSSPSASASHDRPPASGGAALL